MTSLLNKLRPVPSTLLKSNIILKKDVATKVTNLHKQMIRDILSTQFKIKERTAKSLTINDSKILEMPVERLVKVANILQENDVDLKNLEHHMDLLYWKPQVLKHKLFVLQELGIKNLNVAFLGLYSKVMSLPQKIFKAHANLPMDANLPKNIYSHVKEAPEAPEVGEDVNLCQLCRICLKHYLIWRLEIRKEEVDRIFSSLTIHHKSLRIYDSAINVLQHECHFTNEMIKANLKIINCTSEIAPIYKLLQKETGAAAAIFQRCPWVLNKSCNQIRKLMDLIKYYKFPIETARKCPEVLILTPEEFERRLSTLMTYPELRLFYNHPRFLRLISAFRMVQIRVKYMREYSYNHSSVSLLVGGHGRFSNIVSSKDEKSKTNIQDLVYLLNKDFQMDENELKKQIRKHPYWMYCPLMQVEHTFEYLKKHFSLDDIYANLYAVFYPSDNINETLHELKKEYSTTIGDLCFAPTHYLALCIYKMELDHHFSGDGIWSSENKSPVWQKKLLVKEEEEILNLEYLG